MRTIDQPVPHADPITWKSDVPVWVDQWPLTQEKVQATQLREQEQLNSGHIEPSNSPWNSPIFVIKKKSGKWRLSQDLREVNKSMELMDALQPGLPSPAAIPQGTLDQFKNLNRFKRLFLYYPSRSK